MKKNKYLYISIFIIINFLISCDTKIIKTFNLLENYDSTPPKLKYIESESPYCISIVFDEELNSKKKTKLYVDNQIQTNFNIEKNIVTYFQKDKLIPGEKHTLKIKVEDLRGNSTYIESFVYTKNNNLAKVLISEVSTKGTSSNCDKVEIVVTKSGSLAGIVLSDGFNTNYNDRFIFPEIWANEGEFYVVSFKENSNTDFFVSENKAGLSSNNGCIILLESPSYNSKVLDCLIYSNKVSENCEGFANETTLNNAKILANIGMWENTFPLSDNAVDSTHVTSTRTINRKYTNNSFYIDTDTYSDFYTTITKGNSFGKTNNLEEYLIE